MKRWQKVLAGAGGAVVLCFGLIGFAHTKAGRPLLAWMASTAGCPVDLQGGDPVAVEKYRRERVSARDGDTPARSQPALAFALGDTSEADVQRWADALGDSCERQRKGSVIHCENLHLDEGPAVDDLHLQFDGDGQLVAVDAFRSGDDAGATLGYYRAIGQRLDREVGAATAEHALSDEELRARSYRRVAREYRYRGYVASVSVMNYGARGLRVREQYQWVPEDKTASR